MNYMLNYVVVVRQAQRAAAGHRARRPPCARAAASLRAFVSFVSEQSLIRARVTLLETLTEK